MILGGCSAADTDAAVSNRQHERTRVIRVRLSVRYRFIGGIRAGFRNHHRVHRPNDKRDEFSQFNQRPEGSAEVCSRSQAPAWDRISPKLSFGELVFGLQCRTAKPELRGQVFSGRSLEQGGKLCSESRQDFRHMSRAERPGDFRYKRRHFCRRSCSAIRSFSIRIPSRYTCITSLSSRSFANTAFSRITSSDSSISRISPRATSGRKTRLS